MSPARREGTCTLGAGDRIAAVSPSLCALLGRESSQLVGRPFVELIDPADRPAWTEWATPRGPDESTLDVRLTRPQGQGCWVSIASASTAGVLPGDLRLLLVSEAGERRTAELALHDSEDRFDAFMDSSDVVAWMKDESGRFVYVNRAWEVVYGRTRAQVEGLTAHELYPEELAEEIRQRDRAVLEGGRSSSTTERDPVRDRVWQTVRFLFWDHAGARFLGGLALDLSAQRRAEDDLRQLREQYLQAQKMEAVGRLAGGAAHDFNNLLTVVLNYTDLLLQRAGPSDPSREALEQISFATRRAGELARQLLTFSRQRQVDRKVIDLNAELAAMLPMLGRLVGPTIALATDLSSERCWVEADVGELGQVVMNLTINAVDAMPEGGRLFLSSRLAPGAGGGPASVHLEVADTGSGMEDGVRARVFEPFFTTKELGRGTGLGLSTVFGIVKQWGGTIEVTSTVGQGSRFQLCLPTCAEPPSPRADGSPRVAAHGQEVLLLVDDESRVRWVTRLLLEQEGYRVLEAPSPGEALEMLETAQPVSLLITDLLMPGMGGEELSRRACALRPGLKVLAVSGYSADAVPASLPFLQKPYTVGALTQTIRQLLDS